LIFRFLLLFSLRDPTKSSSGRADRRHLQS
jgi:hypothetical protein